MSDIEEVADAEYGLRIYCGDVQCDCVYMRTARLLESLARENARLVNNHHVQNRANAVLAKERDRLAAENAELRRNEEHHVLHTMACPMRSIPGAECLCGDVVATERECDRLRADLASYKAATKLVVEYDRQQAKLDVKKGG